MLNLTHTRFFPPNPARHLTPGISGAKNPRPPLIGNAYGTIGIEIARPHFPRQKRLSSIATAIPIPIASLLAQNVLPIQKLKRLELGKESQLVRLAQVQCSSNPKRNMLISNP